MMVIRMAIGCVIGLAAAAPAGASPFCVDLEGFPLQCLYVDPSQCQHEASRLGGRCSANPQEVQTPPGPGQFCVVEAIGAISCLYADRANCDADSARRSAACISATPQPNPKVPPGHDPFALQRPY
jgi:hypothetical protein